MKTLIENLCGKLESLGIDPITLAKAIGVFLVLVIIIAIFLIFPKLFGVLLVIVICIALIALIYTILEDFD